jgi:hypothetical protein
MAELYLHNQKLESIFELLGHKENDITFSVGWVLANCHSFFGIFLKSALPNIDCTQDATIYLQDIKTGGGITDVEIRGANFHIIIEAKRGWTLPNNEQLSLYAKRLKADNDQQNLLIVMSECSPEYAMIHLQSKLFNIPVKYYSWKNIASLTNKVTNACHAEKRLLEQLRIYLRRVVNMQNQLSNLVFVVSLGSSIPEGCSISWIDIIDKKGRYFHPVGNGWPSNPPNYLGFRYYGKLQRIHHVESWKIVDDLHSEIREIGAGLWQYPHYCYELGPAIIPSKEIKNGKVYPSGRKWAMLDLLLSCDTVSEACDQTHKRLEDNE